MAKSSLGEISRTYALTRCAHRCIGPNQKANVKGMNVIAACLGGNCRKAGMRLHRRLLKDILAALKCDI